MAGIGISISLIGDKALQKKFAKLTVKLQKKFLRKGMRKAAKIVRDTSKILAPKDTGKLARGIKIRPLRAKPRSGIFGISITTGTRQEMGIPSDTKFYYPAHVELGYRKRDGTHVPGVPFLRNALKANKAEVFRIVAGSLRDLIRDAGTTK